MNAGPSIRRESLDKLVTIHFESGEGERLTYFPNTASELRIARAVLLGIHEQAVLCDLVFHTGTLDRIEFNAPPKSVLSEDQLKCGDVRIFTDPMIGLTQEPMSVGTMGPTLNDLAERYVINDVQLPPAEEVKLALFATIDAVLPADYLQLLDESNHFVAGEVEFFGTKVRSIVLPDANWFVLAVSEKYAICAVMGAKNGLLTLYHLTDDNIEKTDTSFVRLIDEINKLEKEPED
jgi:hypothetical protein